MVMKISRGDIFYADLSPAVGFEQGGLRPVVIISDDEINKSYPTVIAVAISSRQTQNTMCVEIFQGDDIALSPDSLVLANHIRTIDKIRVKEYIGHLDDKIMQKVDATVRKTLGFHNS